MLKTGLKIDHERFLLVGKNLSSESEKTVKNKIDISTLVRTQEDFHCVHTLIFCFHFFFLTCVTEFAKKEGRLVDSIQENSNEIFLHVFCFVLFCFVFF